VGTISAKVAVVGASHAFLTVAPFFLMALSATTLARAQVAANSCSAAAASLPGVVWQGSTSRLARYRWFARSNALFSADEPLLGEGRPPIPTGTSVRHAAERAVVYYQVTELTIRGLAGHPARGRR
jgi:hypothetical protein